MKVNHGPCIVCGKPIIFLGCKYCGPRCHFSVLEPADPEPEEADDPPKSQERPTDQKQEAPQQEAAPPRRLYL